MLLKVTMTRGENKRRITTVQTCGPPVNADPERLLS